MDRVRSSHHNGAPAVSTAATTPIPARSKPTTINVPSFSSFQAQNSKINTASPVRRKPLPSSASGSAGSGPRQPLSSGGLVVAVGEEEPETKTSDTHSAPRVPWLPPSIESPPLVVRDLDQYPRGKSPTTPATSQFAATPATAHRQPYENLARPISPTKLNHVRIVSDPDPQDPGKGKREMANGSVQRAATTSLHPGNRPSNVNINGSSQFFSDYDTTDPTVITKTPRSPGPNKLTSFFGWGNSSRGAGHSPSNSSAGSRSPAPSPRSHSFTSYNSAIKPQAIDISKANGNGNGHSRGGFTADTGFPMPPSAQNSAVHIADMEDELREVTLELAGSIRREMELEDTVEQLRQEATQGPDLNRRTSDYFSDSGTSSVRYPMSDYGSAKSEDVAKQKRISEQEQAQVKVDLYQKLQDERDRRKALELHVQNMGEQMQHIDQERVASSSAASRLRDLESALEDSRRRLQEERRTKENFEDLLKALRGEIAHVTDERDNLRDEEIPQLQLRIEGLEIEATEFQKLQYEHSRVQQDLQSMKNENTTLVNARRLQTEMQQQSSRFNTINEEEGQEALPSPLSPGLRAGLTRSNSLARGNVMGGLSKTGSMGSLSRSNSTSAKERENKESLADRVKDIELQRDALHGALKSLLDRQTYQNREHEKKMKALEAERDRALHNQSPRRTGFEKEVKGLRYEINQLRRRADDALNQKWQCEKGLGGLKKDLDRAEQETSSLRLLLNEHDILIPEIPQLSSQDGRTSDDLERDVATSASLERAYKDLQNTQAISISKLRELRGQAPTSADDANTEETLSLLLRSINDAETERDAAQRQADAYRAKAESLEEAENFHESDNASLAIELRASANRVEVLAAQVRRQLDSNSGLRQRLAEAVGRGEREQKASASRITGMQGKLKTLEDKLMSAQQHSEELFLSHEDEVRELNDSHNQQLQRIKSGLRTPTLFSPEKGNSPRSPIFALRSPRLDKTTSGQGMSMNEALRTEVLERKVSELEAALADADLEMKEVVGRMNTAQIEVAELQIQRDEAMRQTRKLQSAIDDEKKKVDELMKN